MNTRARAWCFTLNNYSPLDETRISMLVQNDPQVQYVLYGREVGAQGTPHLQGFIYFTSVKSGNQVKSVVGSNPHVEAARQTGASIDYCKKDGDWVEYGQAPAQGKRNDLEEVRQMIVAGLPERAIADAHFGSWARYNKAFTQYRDIIAPQADQVRTVHHYMGAAGTGKTKRAYEEIRRDGRDLWVWGGDGWFDGYCGQPLVIFDDYDGSIPLARFLKCLDRYPNRQPVKGGFVSFRPVEIWITSNLSVNEWYPHATADQIAAIDRRITDFVAF